jgi:hypothetical protein
MLKLKMAALLVVLAAGILSCKKEKIENSPVPEEKMLVVSFQNSIISINDIDSGSVVLRRQGSNTPIFQRLIKKDSRMETTIDGLPAGEWSAELDLYTKKQADDKSYQFVVTKPVSVSGNKASIVINGPSQTGIVVWKKRLVQSTSDNALVVIIPADPTDPYIEIRNYDLLGNYFHFERIAFSGSAVVAYKQWGCASGSSECPGENRLFYNAVLFTPFTEKIRTTFWDRIEFTITVGNLQSQEFYEFSHQWHN